MRLFKYLSMILFFGYVFLVHSSSHEQKNRIFWKLLDWEGTSWLSSEEKSALDFESIK